MADAPSQPRRRIVIPVEAEKAETPVSVHEGTIFVSRASYGNEEESTEKIRVPLFSSEPARIRVSAGSTNNLGDYNSARVEVMIEMPCYPVRSEIERTYNFIEGLLDEIIPLELAKAGVNTN